MKPIPSGVADKTSAVTAAGSRRPYRAPSLLKYGTIQKLTRGVATVGNDGPGGGMKNNPCL